jgi:hypothetical protein
LILFNEVQRVARGGFGHHTIAHHFSLSIGTKAAGTQQGAGGQANETVSAKPLAPDHRFKQKTVFAIVLGVGQLQIKRQRGFQIRKGFQHQWNAVVALTGQAFEFKFGDHGQVPPKRSATSGEVLFYTSSCPAYAGRGWRAKPHGRSVRLADAKAKLPGLPLGNGSAGRLRRSG